MSNADLPGHRRRYDVIKIFAAIAVAFIFVQPVVGAATVGIPDALIFGG